MADLDIPSPSRAAGAAGPWAGPERPNNASILKLNEGENPYSPPPAALKVLQQTTARSLRLCPDPDSTELRNAIAAGLRLAEEQVLVGPAITELLRWACLAFLEPGSRFGYPWPTWPMAERLGILHRADCVRLHWWGATQEEAVLKAPGDLRMMYIASPGIPTGAGVDTNAIQEFAENHPQCLVLVDEAYEAFRGKSAIRLVRQGIANVVLLRSFSKAHALAGLRIGYALGDSRVLDLIRRAMGHAPVSAPSQSAALAAFKATDWLEETVGKVTATRERVRLDVQMRGFEVPASEASYLYVRCGDAQALYKALKARNILTGIYPQFESPDGIRLALGTDEQMDLFLSALDHVAGGIPKKPPAYPTNPHRHTGTAVPVPEPSRASADALRKVTPIPQGVPMSDPIPLADAGPQPPSPDSVLPRNVSGGMPLPQAVPMSDPIPLPAYEPLPDDLELSDLDLKTEVPAKPLRPTAPPPTRNVLGTQLTPTGIRRSRISQLGVAKLDNVSPPVPPAGAPAPPANSSAASDLDDELDL